MKDNIYCYLGGASGLSRRRKIGLGEYGHEIYEVEGYDSKDWIIEYDPGATLMDNPVLLKSVTVTEIPEELINYDMISE